MTHRIVIVKPCCIGDVIFATSLLSALRRGYPDSSIDWIVGSSAIAALRTHPDLNRVIDSGPLANPASRPASFLGLVRLLRAGKYDLAIVPDRSPLMGLAILASGIKQRAGLDSAGRGFTYNVKAPVDPDVVRHEAKIYLDIAQMLGLNTDNCWANVPPDPVALTTVQDTLRAHHAIGKPLIVVHPGGGVNAGMTMTQKRWPSDRFAVLADRIAARLDAQIILIGANSDQSALAAVKQKLQHSAIDLSNQLSLAEIGALASIAALYIGNDNGVGHLAAASGGKVLMIFGPSDPRRYAPFVPANRAQIAWRPVALPERGVSGGTPVTFDWERDGVSVDEAWQAALKLMEP
jgi:ADP-heptose:LPS heptosyltransferase